MAEDKLTNGDIWGATTPLSQVMGQKFPVMVSYKLAKLAQKINEARKPVEEARLALVKKHGAEDPKTHQFSVLRFITQTEGESDQKKEVEAANPAFEAFSKEFNELMNAENDIKIEKVRIPEKAGDACEKCHHNQDFALMIEPGIFLALDKFIEVA